MAGIDLCHSSFSPSPLQVEASQKTIESIIERMNSHASYQQCNLLTLRKLAWLSACGFAYGGSCIITMNWECCLKLNQTNYTPNLMEIMNATNEIKDAHIVSLSKQRRSTWSVQIYGTYAQVSVQPNLPSPPRHPLSQKNGCCSPALHFWCIATSQYTWGEIFWIWISEYAVP